MASSSSNLPLRGTPASCPCEREESRRKIIARLIRNGTTSAPKKAVSGKCPRCRIAFHRQGMVVKTDQDRNKQHPLRNNSPYHIPHPDRGSCYKNATCRLELNRIISNFGSDSSNDEDGLGFELENKVTNRVYTQLFLEDSPVIDALEHRDRDAFRELPEDLVDELRDTVVYHVEKVTKSE